MNLVIVCNSVEEKREVLEYMFNQGHRISEESDLKFVDRHPEENWDNVRKENDFVEYRGVRIFQNGGASGAGCLDRLYEEDKCIPYSTFKELI